MDLWAVNQLKCFSINQNLKKKRTSSRIAPASAAWAVLSNRQLDRQTDRERGRRKAETGIERETETVKETEAVGSPLNLQ